MSKSLTTKNVAATLIGAALVVAMAFSFATPAKAQSIADLQSQIQALLAQIAGLQGGTTGGASASCTTFTRNHKQGDTGGEVMAIQKFLNSMAGTQVAATGAGSPGMETSTFGPATKAAVAKFQNMYTAEILAPVGLSTGTGYWGAATRAKANALCAAAPTTPTTPTTPGSGGLTGSAGSAIIASTTEDVEDEVLTGTTEKVLGFKVEASGSDIRATNVRVKFTAAVDSSASDRLTDYASEISLWADGQKIAAMSPNDFVRESSGVYTATIPVSQIIRRGSSSKVTFHVGMTANSNIDSDNDGSTNDWTVELTQFRYTDPSSATLFESPSSGTYQNAGVYVNRLSSSSEVELRMAEGSGNPKTKNIQVSDSTTTEVPLLEFTLKADGAAMYFDQLKASTTATGVDQVSDIVQTFYLYRGTTRLAEVAGSSATQTWQNVTFNLDTDEELSEDETKTYTIKAKVGAIGSASATAFSDGDSIRASTSPAVANLNAKATSDGKSISERSGSVTDYAQTLYNEGIQVVKVGESFQQTTSQTAADSVGEFKVTLRVTNFGSNDVYIPLSGAATSTAGVDQTGASGTLGVAYLLANSAGTASTTNIGTSLTRVSGGVEKTNSVLVSGDQSVDLLLTLTFNPGTSFTGANQFRVRIAGVGHATSDSATNASYVFTLPAEDFRTQYYTINN